VLTSLGGPAGWVLLAGACFAIVDWVAVARGSRWMEYVFKPATLVAYLCAAWLLGRGASGGYLAAWFLLALAFSLAGDVFLMLPAERWFLPGLAVFLMGHICYIIGFNQASPPIGATVPFAIALVLGRLLLPRIVRALDGGDRGALRGPVIGYSVVLSLMLVSALSTWFRPEWSAEARVAASVGGVLFYASDLMLAWNEFVAPSKLLGMAVIVVYHVGQLALVLVVGLVR